MDNIQKSLIQIHDYLIPQMGLDVYERSLYLHLFRYTRLTGSKQSLFSIDGLSASSNISVDKVRKSIRAMHDKGCIKIEERSRKGHLIHVVLPHEMEGLLPIEKKEESIDIESIDFFNNRNHLPSLLERDNRKCFYCLRSISSEECELDHVIAQVNGGDNSYRNIVCSCHECNTTKQERIPQDFLRSLFRDDLLSKAELKDRIEAVDLLQAGNLKPNIF